MDIKKIKKTVQNNLDFSKKINENFNRVNEIFIFADEVFESANDISKDATTYLDARRKKGIIAPLAAWRGPNPSDAELGEGLEELTNVMKTAELLIDGMTQLRNSFDEFNKEYYAFLEYQNEEIKKMGAISGHYTDAHFMKLFKILELIPHLNKEMSSIYRRAYYYENELRKVKNELNRLKGVN